jgi:hypothetical protein
MNDLSSISTPRRETDKCLDDWIGVVLRDDHDLSSRKSAKAFVIRPNKYDVG